MIKQKLSIQQKIQLHIMRIKLEKKKFITLDKIEQVEVLFSTFARFKADSSYYCRRYCNERTLPVKQRTPENAL